MKNRTLYIFILTLFVFKQSFAQEKRITGTVEVIGLLSFHPDSMIYKNYDVENFRIILLKQIDKPSKGKKIYKSKGKSSFDIIISKKHTKKYQYIEFTDLRKTQTSIVKLDTLTEKSYTIILEMLPVVAYKPAIYLYPETKSEITINLDYKGKILNTYPLYDKNWKVIAEPNGTLHNIKDNRTYNYLFWDGVYTFRKEHFDYKSGFYVKQEETVAFLQEKLSFIGLNNTEINDFIVYWIPELSKNSYNFIHFRINDNIDNSAFLNVTPEPESSIRVFMEFKGYKSLLGISKLPKQELMNNERKGFTLVEWGGGKIGERIIH